MEESDPTGDMLASMRCRLNALECETFALRALLVAMMATELDPDCDGSGDGDEDKARVIAARARKIVSRLGSFGDTGRQIASDKAGTALDAILRQVRQNTSALPPASP